MILSGALENSTGGRVVKLSGIPSGSLKSSTGDEWLNKQDLQQRFIREWHEEQVVKLSTGVSGYINYETQWISYPISLVRV